MDESSANNEKPDAFNEKIRALLNAYRNGNPEALDELIDFAYPQLCKIAHNLFRNERPDHTQQTNSLVHEALIKLDRKDFLKLENEKSFFGLITFFMRRVLIEYARKKSRIKNGKDYLKVSFDDVIVGADGQKFNYVELGEALDKLAELDKRQAAIVDVHYFGGFSIEETAKIFNIAVRTVNREWRSAQAWLLRYLKGEDR